MKSFILKLNSYEKSIILNKNYQIGFSAWKQGNRISFGTWGVFLVNEGTFRQILGTIEFSNPDDKDWMRVTPLNWMTCTEDNITEFGIILELVINKDRSFKPIYPEDWKFKIYIKTKEESGEGIREPEEFLPTVEFCSNSINVLGPYKPLGALCPYDPDTKSHMNECLNWRRVDETGKACRSIMNQENRKESIYSFCMNNIKAADCKCINKFEYEDYLSKKDLYTDPDYCWYFPCKSGAYLVDKEGDSIKCSSNNCIISYNNTNVEGNINLDKNSSTLQCFNTGYSNEYFIKKILIILGILLLLFSLFK